MLKHVIDLNRDYSHHIITDTKEIIAVGHDVENAWKNAALYLDNKLYEIQEQLQKICDEHLYFMK